MVVKKKRKKGITVDMAGVESGGRAVPDGFYSGYPFECEEQESEAGNPMLVFKWKITDKGKKGAAGATVWDNVSLTPQALWRFKTILEILEIDVPDGEMDIDPDDLVGEDKEIMLEITNETYKGKEKPRITNFGSLETWEETEEEEEEEEKKPVKGSKKKTASKKEEEEEEEEEAEEDEEEEKKPVKKDAKLGKKKIKAGAKVSFDNGEGKTIIGTVTEIDGDTAKVEDKKGEEWEIEASDLELV